LLLAGSGPRHTRRYVYYRNLLEVWWSFLFERKVEKIDQTTILANGFKGTFTGADIHISPDGNFLYASNRGEGIRFQPLEF
jgi:6-phosphogluconolactonase